MSEVEPVRAGSDPETLQTAALVLLEAGLGVLVATATLTMPTGHVLTKPSDLQTVTYGCGDQGEHGDRAGECFTSHFKSPVNVDDLLANYNCNLNFTGCQALIQVFAKERFLILAFLSLIMLRRLAFAC